MMTEQRFEAIKKELTIKTSRSQGPGGQHVNKVSSRVEIRFNIRHSQVLSESEKDRLEHMLHSRVTREGDLLIVSQASRSQLYNKEDGFRRLFQMLSLALRPRKKRVASRPTRASVSKRLENKRMLSEKKQGRSKHNF
ncbi:MAG: aminoacyl-tRNA hydrolase [Bacteroidales bacterium]|nr:aminoacyl-tRNA hydrolase [Bacteroidales bacterium]